jgi:hypothetical protein
MSGFLGMMFPGGGSGGLPPVTPSTYVAFGGATTGKLITVYNWNSSSGFGSAFTTPSISAQIHQVSFVPDNSIFSASFWVAPYFYVWQWSTLGFGTRYANPSSVLNPSNAGPTNYSWTKNLDALISGNNNAPSYPQAWRWSNATGFGSKYANGPALNSTGTANAMALNSDSTQVAFTHTQSPGVSLFPWSSSTGFGSKYANPATIPVGRSAEGCTTFNAVTNDLAIGLNTSPFVAAYAVTSAGFGSKYANPASFIGGTVYATRFAPNGAAIAIGCNITPAALKVYQWGAGFGSLYSSPSITVPVIAADWSSTTDAVSAGNNTSSPYVSVYPWTSGGFGAKYADPSVAPGTVYNIAFSNQSR